jgi:hypothetical protein
MNFLSQGTLFTNQFSQGINGFEQELFGPNGLVGQFVLPLVDRLLQKLLSSELQGILGPTVTKNLITGITNITNTILTSFNATTDELAIEQFVLNEFTALLCDVIPDLEKCPPAPIAGSPYYLWDFQIGNTKVYTVDSLSFDLGLHGVADFDLNCGEVITLEWGINFALYYSPNYGVTLLFNQSTLFQAEAKLAFTPNCALSGYIGFLGADIYASGGLQALLKVPSSFSVSFDVTANLVGKTELGFAGPLAEQIAGSDVSL